MFDLHGKVALVTGATSGIGKAAALALAQAGAQVVVAGRRETEGRAVVAHIEQAGGRALFVRTDVAIEDDVANLIQHTISSFGRLDIAFNNAGTTVMGAVTEVTSPRSPNRPGMSDRPCVVCASTPD